MEKRGKGRKPVSFGGRWTDIKLDVLAKYLRAYTTALKRQPFQKIYVDAFAGTGYREPIRVAGAAQASCSRSSPRQNRRSCGRGR